MKRADALKKLKREDAVAKEVGRIYVHEISSQDDVSLRFRKMYSRMKYSDPEAVRSAAILLMNKIIENSEIKAVIDRGEEFIISSSAFGAIPTAAYAVMLDVKNLLVSKGAKIIEVKIDRHGDFSTTTYGSMSTEEREKRMASRKICISDENKKIMENKVCIIIDDVNVTGSHEKTLANIIGEVAVKKCFFCYLLNFSDYLATTCPQMEDTINHTEIKDVFSLRKTLKVPNKKDKKLIINARTIKYILSCEGCPGIDMAEKLVSLREFFMKLEADVLKLLYKTAMSADGYWKKPKFIDGFHLLCDVMVQRKVETLSNIHYNRDTVTPYLVGLADGNIFNIETGENLNWLGERYSRMKFGSEEDIKWFAMMISEHFIKHLADTNDPISKKFLEVKTRGEHIVMLSPGSRNVESAQNFIFEEAIKRINVFLAINNLPTIILCKLTRYGSGTANYAQLSTEARMREKRKGTLTRSVMPGEDFFQPGVHVLFADDARVTGASADRVEVVCLERGALSFISLYCVVVDPLFAKEYPAFEHFMNTFFIQGSLDQKVLHILNQTGFRPVQRMLRLLFSESNRNSLKGFLQDVTDNSLIKIYESALGNNYNDDERYSDSVLILFEVLKEKKLITDQGLLI